MGTGVGEAMLISAAVGAGTGGAGAAIAGGDPFEGALKGAAMGAVTGGIGSAIGGVASTGANFAGTASEAALAEQIAKEAALNAGTEFGGAALPSITPPVTPPPVISPPASPMANPLINANGEMSEGIASLNNVASRNPVSIPPAFNSSAPTYEYGGIKGNLVGSTNAPPSTPAAPKGMFDFGYKGPTPNVFEYGPQSNMALGMIGATSGLTAASQVERDKYGIPPTEKYTGPLSRFKYDPSTYNPDIVRPPNPPYRPVYAAEGGIMSLAPNGYAMGGVATRPPQTNFANPAASEMGTSQYSVATDPYSGNIAQRMAEGGIADLSGRIKNLGEYQKTMGQPNSDDFLNMVQILGGKSSKQNYASGGLSNLGSYSDGGRMLKGPGDGMSDDIPAMIGKKQPARLADGEFVIPADVVSHLGNGSTDAGAKKLYSMMGKVRKARVGTKKQGKQINPNKYLYA